MRPLCPGLLLVTALLAGCAAPDLPRRDAPGATFYTNLSDEEAHRLAEPVRETVRDLCALLALPLPRKPVRIHLFDWNWQRRLYLRAHCPPQSRSKAACFRQGDDIVIVLALQWSRAETLRLLRHEAVHYTLETLYDDLPPWVHEGLARYFELGPPYGHPHPDALDLILPEARQGGGAALDALVRAPDGVHLHRKDYARAWALVGCLLDRTPDGPARLKRYIADTSPRRDAVLQFRDAFGLTPEELAPDWSAWVLRQAERRNP